MREKLKAYKDKRATQNKNRGVRFLKKRLVEEILVEAKVLNRHMGAARIVAENVEDEVANEITEAKTEDELMKVASVKLKKYDRDLAYIYKNRDKII